MRYFLNAKTLFLVALAVFLLCSTGFSLANATAPQFEVRYPSLLGFGNPSLNSLTRYIQYIFIFAFMAAGIIGVISIVVAGFQKLLYAGSPAKAGEANERIKNAILGIVILMTSFIILRTINPSLVSLMAPSSILTAGVYFVEPNIVDNCPPADFTADGACKDELHPDGYAWTVAEQRVGSTTDLFGSSSVKLLNYCPLGISTRTILLWKYNDYFYHIDDSANGTFSVETISMPCTSDPDGGEVITNPILSFFWMNQNAGVYYYMNEDCTGLASQFDAQSAGQTVSGNIPWFEDQEQNPDLDQTIQSFKILNDPGQNFNYGVILTNAIDAGGECSESVFKSASTATLTAAECILVVDDSDDPGEVSTLDGEMFIAWYAHVLKQDKNPDANPRNHGLTFKSSNKQHTLDQTGNQDPTRNIELLWKYDKNSTPRNINYPDNELDPSDLDYIGPTSFPNDGNLDNLIREEGVLANGGFPELPEKECLAYRAEHPYDFAFDPTYIDPRSPPIEPDVTGRGYRSCLNRTQWEGNYTIVLYTHEESIEKRSCQLFDSQESMLFYDGSVEPPYSNLPGIFTQFQTLYRTVVVPTK